ncbi:Cell wall surface anchor family protein [Rhodotorula toruloides ATCC 204091]|uniref:BY PROTMAP: gi/342321502/gb/EGU13435.1/ Cell wall surface anchor family protein [Rhodotorula glutinis ATCC 204091] n=1 Tax=Rhodotorula toruloides TaxID=5286 RepID=A0A0K3CN86_RHOTO|nr:Cell wall surface anchor family protein [Rhodotorula toruloides ATCC 204091]KAK4333232.1 Cell wall surface anchor family protein [Rhodotorula toruloides]PRQ73346.1 hypothetical protein AAT19DRAFT_16099 [Rhodotorula toruloides]
MHPSHLAFLLLASLALVQAAPVPQDATTTAAPAAPTPNDAALSSLANPDTSTATAVNFSPEGFQRSMQPPSEDAFNSNPSSSSSLATTDPSTSSTTPSDGTSSLPANGSSSTSTSDDADGLSNILGTLNTLQNSEKMGGAGGATDASSMVSPQDVDAAAAGDAIGSEATPPASPSLANLASVAPPLGAKNALAQEPTYTTVDPATSTSAPFDIGALLASAAASPTDPLSGSVTVATTLPSLTAAAPAPSSSSVDPSLLASSTSDPASSSSASVDTAAASSTSADPSLVASTVADPNPSTIVFDQAGFLAGASFAPEATAPAAEAGAASPAATSAA